MKKKLAIISSYNELCGNASYTHVLKEELSRHFDVDVLSVNHRLLTNAHPVARRRGDAYIRDMADKLRGYDYVNIQFEAGLYGYSLASAFEHIRPLIDASRSLLFTIHRVYNPVFQSPLWKTALRNGRRIKETLRVVSAMREAQSFGRIIDYLKLHQAKGHNVCALVHSGREREMLDVYYGFSDVFDYPITFLNKAQIDEALARRKKTRQQVFEKYALDEDAKYIGIFGFMSENKGHHIAVDVLEYLPPDYKLAIFGSQHPQAIREYNLGAMLDKPEQFRQNSNPYIASLVAQVKALRIREVKAGRATSPDKDRVRFLGSPTDPEFIDAMLAMDFIVLPYLEIGQGGSGNASLALELRAKVLFSRSLAFMELSRYYPGCFDMTDIGNACEIAQKIYAWSIDRDAHIEQATGRFNIENNVLVQKAALEGGITQARAVKAELTRVA